MSDEDDIFTSEGDLIVEEAPTRDIRTREFECLRCGDPFEATIDIDEEPPRRCKKCERERRVEVKRVRLSKVRGLDNI